MKNTIKTILAATLASLAFAAPFQASATETQLNFTYQQAELAHEAGRTALAKRLHAFARSACRGSAMTPYAIRKKCESELIAQFVAQIDDAHFALNVAEHRKDEAEIG